MKCALTKSRQDARIHRDVQHKRTMLNQSIASVIKTLCEELYDRDEHCVELKEECAQLAEQLKPSIPIPQTKEGNKYKNNIRVLYYRLLARQIHLAQIAPCIRDVLDTFCPKLQPQLVELPKQSLAIRMRSNELLTVNHAQQASVLAASRANVLGSDGTTLNQ